MTITEFNNLSFERRCDTVWDWGFYIGKQRQDEVNKILFSIYDFYAEVSLRLTDNEIVEVTAIDKDELRGRDFFSSVKNNVFVATDIASKHELSHVTT
jgi:hypothetical protein